MIFIYGENSNLKTFRLNIHIRVHGVLLLKKKHVNKIFKWDDCQFGIIFNKEILKWNL